jgi:hypothetical protein
MITIYWAIDPLNSLEGLRATPPVPIMNKFMKDWITEDVTHEIHYNKCPAFVNELTNVYGMKSIYDYDIHVDNNNISTKGFIGEQRSYVSENDHFFRSHVNVRSMKGRLFSFQQGMVFFTESPSLIMSQLPAFMEDNNITKNTICIPGQFDIGKYFRTHDFAWHLKRGCNTIEFNRKEITFYLKFHTKEKIKFQRFLFTPELDKLNSPMQLTKGSKKPEPLSQALNFYYNIFNKYNLKNKMLKIIKENLCKAEDLEGNVIVK